MLDHLWLHFARHGPDITPPVITRGEGVTIFDDTGKSYLDGLSGLFVVQVGHGRAELAQAAARQAEHTRLLSVVGIRHTTRNRVGRPDRGLRPRAT